MSILREPNYPVKLGFWPDEAPKLPFRSETVKDRHHHPLPLVLSNPDFDGTVASVLTNICTFSRGLSLRFVSK